MHVKIASVASVVTNLNKKWKIVKLEIRVNSCNIGLETGLTCTELEELETVSLMGCTFGIN